MSWKAQLRADPLPWLLEPGDPGVRYLALRDLVGLPADDPELLAARQAAHTQGPIAAILAAMEDEGYWVKPGAGYNPKYRSAVWSLIALAQLGASVDVDKRISRACAYLLEHALAAGGQFSASGAPSSTIDCLQGNLCAALLDLGYQDARIDAAFEWMARSITGEGITPNTEKGAAVRYYAYQCGPNFACGANDGEPCAWGATKEMLAMGKLPASRRTPQIDVAIEQGVQFLLSTDPAGADYPRGANPKPSGNWWKFGFPVFYITDLLQIVEALTPLGYGDDPRLARSLELIREKSDAEGRWPLEYDYAGKTWVDFGPKRQPSKWVTLRALRVLKPHAG
jgi:hypothetical protein